MKNEKLLYVILGVLFVLYVVIEQYAPKPLDWTPTFSHLDKNPYGGFILFDRLEDFFDGAKEVSFQTLYELRDSSAQVMILATYFDPSPEDIAALYAMLGEGRDVLISAERYSDQFLDSAGVSQQIRFAFEEVVDEDTVAIAFDGQSVMYPSPLVRYQFDAYSGWQVHAEAEYPVLISRQERAGRLILSSTPLVFTNYGILHADNYRFAEFALRMIRNGQIVYNRFYHSGKAEPQTPFRYVLSQESLRWALYLTLLAVFVLLVVGSRRKQRMIPLLDAKENTTIKYIKTIGGLYHQEADHKGVAEKIIRFFLKSLAEKYYVSSFYTESSYRMLGAKTGLKTEAVIETFDLIQQIRNSRQINESVLKNLQQKITLFNLK